MSKQTVSEVRALLATIDNLTDPRLAELAADDRKGVQAALRQHQRRVERQQAARQAFQQRFNYERQLWQSG